MGYSFNNCTPQEMFFNIFEEFLSDIKYPFKKLFVTPKEMLYLDLSFHGITIL